MGKIYTLFFLTSVFSETNKANCLEKGNENVNKAMDKVIKRYMV